MSYSKSERLSFVLGEVIDPKNRCKKCHGKKVCDETKILEVNLFF